ncbi:MAG: hypothetical protein HND44_13390 [Chloroflexi bacterium]|nr:hypothetical protein [Chloroflexota bacterium]NOG35550.1 hypothetical protein [Chloroflexota bacterium]GIK55693.1 MAG: hypothetical protein BroJett015_13560 [Chloroflexota bacterium]
MNSQPHLRFTPLQTPGSGHSPERAAPHSATPCGVNHRQAGQSIVLIALALVGIVAFMGIALDVGFIFMRGSQLQAAIDSAALAGINELSGWSPNDPGNQALEATARTKSAQFLNANGMPLSVTLSLNQTQNLHVSQSALGVTSYTITGTWPVETFFLKVIGFREPINLSRSATAAVFSLANVYTSRHIENGIINTSSQGIFGPNICTNYGDPYSPFNSAWAPGPYTYKYRIMIPPDYEERAGTSILRVEILDPDSINVNASGPFNYTRTQAAQNAGLEPTGSGTCEKTNNRKNPCLVGTGELALYNNGTLPLASINPYWFIRMDENRGSATPGNCGEPGSYTATYNTQTLYELYYFQQQAGGAIIRNNLASYTGQVGDGVRDNGSHKTDMQWVSPGAVEQSFDYYTIPGATDVPADNGSFEINLSSSVPGIVVEAGSGIRYLNLDVTTISGSSENGFELWAGPPGYINTVPGAVNARNLHVLNNPGSHSSKGVSIFASGILPLNSNFAFPIDIPLVYVGPEMAGRNIYVSLFDYDQNDTVPPITFFFDSISRDDWELQYGMPGVTDPDGQARNCTPGTGCNNKWVTPSYKITVPGGNIANCDYGNPQNDPDCVPFYGGRLTAHATAGYQDTYVWRITVDGLPYLEK